MALQERLLENKRTNTSIHNLTADVRPSVKVSSRKSYIVFFFTLTLSIAFHVALVLLLPLLDKAPPNRQRALEVWLTKPKKIEKKATENNDKEQKTVVTLVPTKQKKRPDKARYLAEFNQTAKIEQKARIKDTKLLPNNAEDLAKPKGESIAHLEGRFIKRQKTLDPLGLKPQFSESGYHRPVSDALPLVQEGEDTELNAWQWRHAPFFNRIKSRVGSMWAPLEQISRVDPQGLMLGHKDRITVLTVSIDRAGKIVDLDITDGSGVAYLDEEAERAFRKAAPFPFPPQELFLQEDKFSFSFAFHLQINRRISFKFQWEKS